MKKTTSFFGSSWILWFVIFCVVAWFSVKYLVPRSLICSQGENAVFFPVICSGYLHF